MEEDDIEAVIKTAAHIHTTNRHRPLNPLSALPSSKAKLKISIKERIRYLVGAYIALATFIDDDELTFIEQNPKSGRTREIYDCVSKNLEQYELEVKNLSR